LTVKSRASAKADEETKARRRPERRVFFMVAFLIVFILTIISISNGHATVIVPSRIAARTPRGRVASAGRDRIGLRKAFPSEPALIWRGVEPLSSKLSNANF
jgi:hypothetical protein